MKGNRYARRMDVSKTRTQRVKERTKKLGKTKRVQRLNLRLHRIRQRDRMKQSETHQSALMESYASRRKDERQKQREAEEKEQRRIEEEKLKEEIEEGDEDDSSNSSRLHSSDDDGDDVDSVFSDIDFDVVDGDARLRAAQAEEKKNGGRTGQNDAAVAEENTTGERKSYYSGRNTGPRASAAREMTMARDAFYRNHGSTLRPGASTTTRSVDTESRYVAAEVEKKRKQIANTQKQRAENEAKRFAKEKRKLAARERAAEAEAAKASRLESGTDDDAIPSLPVSITTGGSGSARKSATPGKNVPIAGRKLVTRSLY